MATIVHECDVLLQGAAVRDLNPDGDRGLWLLRDASLFQKTMDASGPVPVAVYAPAQITLTAKTMNLPGTITWTTDPPGVALAPHPDAATDPTVQNVRILTPAAMGEYLTVRVLAQLVHQGRSYEAEQEISQVAADGGAYTTVIESSKGTVFRPGEPATTLLVAHVFHNGVEVTDLIDQARFRWRRFSAFPQPAPNDDATWNALYATGYKQISLTIDAVNIRATFHCDIQAA